MIPEGVAFQKPQAANVVGNGVPPNLLEHADINGGFGNVFDLFVGRVGSATVAGNKTVFDICAATVDQPAERVYELAVYDYKIMRESRALGYDSEVQLLIYEKIFAEKFLRGVPVVKIIKVGHR